MNKKKYPTGTLIYVDEGRRLGLGMVVGHEKIERLLVHQVRFFDSGVEGKFAGHTVGVYNQEYNKMIEE